MAWNVIVRLVEARGRDRRPPERRGSLAGLGPSSRRSFVVVAES